MRRSRSRARSKASSSARERRTPGSRWNAFTTSAPSLPLGLEVGAPDDPVAPEKGEDVVAVLPLRRGLVQLDHVLEAERARRELIAPEQVVERREEDGCARPRAVELDARLDDDRRTAVIDGDPLEPALGDEGVDVRARGLRAA